MQHFITCRVSFYPDNDQEQLKLTNIVRQCNAKVQDRSSITFGNNCLSLAGYGNNWRCNICHAIRAEAKNEQILFLSRCPYEKDDSFSWRIQIGKSYFDISILYRAEYYKKMKIDDPGNLLVRTHLAVINEYYGNYAAALQEYAFIVKRDSKDTFASRRLKAVSKLLLQEKKQEKLQEKAKLIRMG